MSIARKIGLAILLLTPAPQLFTTADVWQYICDVIVIYTISLAFFLASSPVASTPNSENRQAFSAFQPSEVDELENRGVDPKPAQNWTNIDDSGYSPAVEEINKTSQEEACREAYDIGITNVDKALSHIRQATGEPIANSNKNRKWVKSNFFIWKNGEGNVYFG